MTIIDLRGTPANQAEMRAIMRALRDSTPMTNPEDAKAIMDAGSIPSAVFEESLRTISRNARTAGPGYSTALRDMVHEVARRLRPQSEMKPVSSTNVAAIGYDAAAAIFRVRFKDGRTYAYQGVPQDVADGIFEAKSVGRAVRVLHSYPSTVEEQP